MEFPFKKNYSLSVNELFINLQNYQYKLIHDSFNNKITSFKTNILGKPANFGYYGPLLKDTFNTIIASSEDYDKIDILVDVIGQEEQRLKAKKIYTSCSAWDYYHSDEGHKNLVNNLTNKNKEIN